MSDVFATAAARLLQSVPENAFSPSLRAPVGDALSVLELESIGAKPAAVLVPLVAHESGVCVLLTRRAAALRSHSGQIAFPGGRIDDTDATALAAALRETKEEIGLDARYISVLGYLDAYQTGTGYRIQPVVARVLAPFELHLNAEEVDSVFEVPLAFLMDPTNHQRETRVWQGHTRSFYAMPFGAHYIWGATAGILRNLYERLYL